VGLSDFRGIFNFIEPDGLTGPCWRCSLGREKIVRMNNIYSYKECFQNFHNSALVTEFLTISREEEL
jgi:hypothetical protein